MIAPFKITKDKDGKESYGLTFEDGLKYTTFFSAAGDEHYILLDDTFKVAVFKPETTLNYVVSFKEYSAIPSDTLIVPNDQELNSGVVGLENWQFDPLNPTEKRMYIYPLSVGTLTVRIFGG